MKTLLTVQIQKSDSDIIFINYIAPYSIRTETDFLKVIDELVKEYKTTSVVVLFMKEFAEED